MSLPIRGSPPLRHPCIYGIDMSTIQELFAPRFMHGGPLTPEVQAEMAAAIGITASAYSLRTVGLDPDASPWGLPVRADQLLGAVFIVVVAAVNYSGIKRGALLQNLSTVFKVGALGLLIILGFLLGHGMGFGPMLAQPNQLLERWRDITDAGERDRVLKRNLGALMLAHEASMDPLALHIYADDVTRARIRPAKFINDRDFTMIERLACRVAGISGALDPLGVPSPAAQGEALLKARPDARFRLIDDAGHWVAYEAPDQFNAVLRSLLSD